MLGREHICRHDATVVCVVHAGEGDCVMCFKCGGRLKNWQPDEDPWEEHAKHYPG